MCAVGRRLFDRGLIGAREGNISVRAGAGSLLCTPHGKCKGELRPEELVLIGLDGSPRGEGRPSSEIGIHLAILAAQPQCTAVVHAHPLTATAFGVAGRSIPEDLLPEASYVLGRVALVPFRMPGTSGLADEVGRLAKAHKTLLLSHHGATTAGADLWDACDRMETLERVAQIILRAEALGGAVELPEKERAAVAALSESG